MARSCGASTASTSTSIACPQPSSARSAPATSSPASSWPGWRRRRSTPRRWRRRCPRPWRRRRGRASGGAHLNSWKRPTRRRVRAIRDRLRLVYGIPLAKPHGHPIAELILTVLSQSTNHRNRDVAYLALRQRFPVWEDVRDAPVDEVEEAIRPGGISKVKSSRIKSILAAITDTAPAAAGPPGVARDPPLPLAGLLREPVPEAQAYLTS